MSERYGICLSCNGTGKHKDLDGCMTCGDTGWDGSIDALERPKISPPIQKREYESPMDRAIAIVKERLNKRNLL